MRAIGDYVNISGCIGIVVSQPEIKSGTYGVYINGRIQNFLEKGLSPLTEEQENALRLVHTAIFYGIEDNLIEKLQSLNGSAKND